MASPSPSEFLTFSRRALQASRCRSNLLRSQRPLTLARPSPFLLARRCKHDDSVKTDALPDDQHATDKKAGDDVQAEQTEKGKSARANNEGGAATSRSDTRNSTQRTKDEHPEAPDVVIGMQDERGGKGRA